MRQQEGFPLDAIPSTHYHSAAVRRFNRVARCFNLVGLRRIDLGADALIAQARRETGLRDFGDERFMPALETLLVSIEADAALNPFGRKNAQARIVRSLKNRLWANECYRRHPEILAADIVAPIVIVGPHRSGTTRLQRLLATDIRLQHLRTWEGLNPAPWLDRPGHGREERHAEICRMLAASQRMHPGVAAAHPMSADWPEEEMLLLNHAFCSFSYFGIFNTRGYYDWFCGIDKDFAYRDLAAQMKLISWSRKDPPGKRWILKNPQHMHDLDALLRVFPDARLVFTHRDPLKTVSSVLSLMWHYAVQNTDVPCRGKTREIWLDFCGRMVERAMHFRPQIPADQQLDVYYHDINADWRREIRRIYAFAGIECTAAAEDAMGAWFAASERENRHGGHSYRAADFGIDDAGIELRMKDYRECYAIPREQKA